MKRQLGEGGEGDRQPPNPNKRPHFFSTMFSARTLQDHMPRFEPMIRKLVKEEVESAIDRLFLRSGSRPLQLQFESKLPLVGYTGNKIVSDDGSPVKFGLYDTASKELVTCGPYSSIKVEIVVLDGDWSKDDLDAKVVHSRQDRGPLLTGPTTVKLQDGIGCACDVTFTDNSSWTRSGKFRLGLKSHSDFDTASVRQGVSNAFRVKDHRGELYQKHHPPWLDDEVWRLEKIGKDGASHKRLTESGVSCVGDLLRAYAISETSLRAVLPKVSNKKWEAIIKHAMTCRLDDKTYSYRTPQGAGLVFNSIYKAVRVTFDGLNFHSVDRLDSYQTIMMEDMKQHAYRNLSSWEDCGPHGGNSNDPSTGQQDMQMNNRNNNHSTISLPHAFEVEKELRELNVTFDNGFGKSGSSESLYIEQPTWTYGGNPMEPQLSPHDFTADDDFEI